MKKAPLARGLTLVESVKLNSSDKGDNSSATHC